MKSFLALVVLVAVCCTGDASPTSQNSTGLRQRFRRNASARCCNDGFEDSENHAKVTEVRHECAEELGLSEMSEEELLKDREHLICLIECITKKHDLADEHGNLHHEDLEKAVHEHFSVAEWKAPLLDGFIKECFDEAEDEHSHHETEEGKCNEEGFQFAYCLWRHFTLACPEELQDKSERCEGIRSKLASNEKVSFWNNDIDES
uniref:Putative odorant-binding protein n=1 Tax=Culex tarsalis TaxID=7177 RepID=A0A1Q3FRW7_CULTA